MILPELTIRTKPEIQAIVQSMMQREENHGMKSIRMLRMTIMEEVLRTAMAMAMFFQRQQSAMKKTTPRP